EWRYQGAQLVSVEYPEGCLREEIGHAIFALLRDEGALGPFSTAYAAEATAARADPQASLVLWYQLQPGDAGADETFAVLFASEYGGGPDPLLIPRLHRWFPNALHELREVMK